VESIAQGLDGPTDAKVNKSLLTQGQDENSMIADEERVFMHSSDARIFRSGRASEYY